MPRNRSEKEPTVEGVEEAVLEVVRVDARVGKYLSHEGNEAFTGLSDADQTAYQALDCKTFYLQYKEWLDGKK